MHLANNLVLLRSKSKMTAAYLAGKLGVSRGTVTNYENGVSNPDLETLAEIAKIFDISVDNLLLHNMSNAAQWSVASEDDSPKYNKSNPITFFNLDVTASDVDVFGDIGEQPIKIDVPGFKDCQFAFPVYGHSMYPIYESGSIIICKQIKDLDVIHYGEVHLLITIEQRLLKRVQRGKKEDTILLLSDNNETRSDGVRKYESFEMDKKKIRHLFLVKGSIKRNQI